MNFRRHFNSWRASAGCALQALACAAALGGPAAAGGNVLRFGIDAADLGTADPHKAASRNDRAVVDMLFNGLLRYAPGQAPAIEPDIAAEIPTPRVENGKQVWRFTLRDDVYCQESPKTDAYLLNADDVVYSIRRAADPKMSSYAGDYAGMEVIRVDDRTVDVSLEKPLSSILFFPKFTDYAGGFIVCQKPAEAMGGHGLSHPPVGTGPFQLDSREAGVSLTLAANPRYFRGAPALSGVKVHYLPDFEDRDALFNAGSLDVIFGSESQDWHDVMEQNTGAQVDIFGVGQVITAHFDTTKPPLDNPDVRKALIYALDRDVFRSQFAEGVVENVFSIVPAAFLPGGLQQEEAARLGVGYAHDPEKAKQLLAAAGLEDGFSMRLVSSERPHYLLNYQSLQQQLAAVGVEVEIEVVPHRDMHKRIRNDENDIVIYVAWRPNADVFLTRFFHSDSTVLSGRTPDTNFSHYDGIDPLIEQARLARKPADQVRFWKQAQIKLLHDAAAFPLHYINLVYARRNNVDYGHPLKASMSLYPQFTEQTSLSR